MMWFYKGWDREIFVSCEFCGMQQRFRLQLHRRYVPEIGPMQQLMWSRDTMFIIIKDPLLVLLLSHFMFLQQDDSLQEG